MKKMHRREFVLGYNSEKEPVSMKASPRPEHLAIYGIDTRGKENIMMHLAQEATGQSGGATFIVETPHLAGALYKILRENRKKRAVKWLNLEHSLGIKNQGQYLQEYEETIMDQYVFNYQSAIESGSFVIIDMECLKNGAKAERTKRLLVKHLIQKLAKTAPNKHAGHDIYMEHIEGFEQELKELILFGPSLNSGVRLVVESPQSFKDVLPIVGACFKHVVLMPQFSPQDAPYYKLILSLEDERMLFNRAEGVALYGMRDELGKKRIRGFNLKPISQEEVNRLIANGKRTKHGIYQKFAAEEHTNDYLINLRETAIADNDDWAKTSQMLASLSTPTIPKHPEMKNEKQMD